MRDATIIAQLDEYKRAINAIAYHMQLGFSGEALFDETLKSLLFKKGIITETEFKEALSEKIREVNAKDAETAKAEAEKLATPTPAEVAKVEETKAE
jgi:hypothetical protein